MSAMQNFAPLDFDKFSPVKSGDRYAVTNGVKQLHVCELRPSFEGLFWT